MQVIVDAVYSEQLAVFWSVLLGGPFMGSAAPPDGGRPNQACNRTALAAHRIRPYGPPRAAISIACGPLTRPDQHIGNPACTTTYRMPRPYGAPRIRQWPGRNPR